MESELNTNSNDKLTVGIAQIAPVWLNREATIKKIIPHRSTSK